MGTKIRWIKAAVGRELGHEETVGLDEMAEKWIACGFAERIDATPEPVVEEEAKTETEEPVEVETADMTEPPIDRVIRAPGERKVDAEPEPKAPPKPRARRRRRTRNESDG